MAWKLHKPTKGTGVYSLIQGLARFRDRRHALCYHAFCAMGHKLTESVIRSGLKDKAKQ